MMTNDRLIDEFGDARVLLDQKHPDFRRLNQKNYNEARAAVLARMSTTTDEIDLDIVDVEQRVWAAMVGPAGIGHTVPTATAVDLMRVRRVIAAARVCPIPLLTPPRP